MAVLRRFVVRRSLLHYLIGCTVATAAGAGINYFVPAYLGRAFGPVPSEPV